MVAELRPIRKEIKFKATMVKGSSYRIGGFRFTKDEPTQIVDFRTGKELMLCGKFRVERTYNE